MQKKIIFLPELLNTSIIYVDVDKFLVFKSLSNVRFVSIPFFVKTTKKDNALILICPISGENYNSVFNQFITRLELAVKTINITFKRKLTLKGLGFRIKVCENKKVEFKIGFSHLIYLTIPSNLKIRTNKNFMYLQSNDNVLLGNFIDKVISLKAPDSYKGKGFWYKYQEKILKVVKKK